MENADRDFAMTTLDAQTDMFRFWARTTVGQRYVEEVIRLNIDMKANSEETSIHLAMSVIENSLTSPTYGVTEDIVDVIDAALSASSEKELFHISESDVPYPAGFVLLQRPIVASDNHGKPLVVKAVSWTIVNVAAAADPSAERFPALYFMAWTDPSDERDHLFGQWNEYKDKFPTPHHLVPIPAGTYVLDTRRAVSAVNPDENVTMFMVIFFLFIQELWVNPRVVDPGRPARRRHEHVTKMAPPTVSVVQLRRSSHEHREGHGGEDPQEWSHRWLVRGHWRNQWYPSTQEHRPKWIAEHIKGPDDKPLIVKEKIFSVSR